jgi:putative transposase
LADGLNIDGGIPPAFLNHRVPTACDTPAATAASSLAIPAAIATQNRRRSSRPVAGGRPGENRGARPDRSDRRFRTAIATSFQGVLRRPLESALFGSIALVHQAALAHRAALAQRLFERIQHEVRSC